VLGLAVMGFLFFRSKHSEVWEEEVVEPEATFIEGLGYVFNDEVKEGCRGNVDEGEFCYLLDKLRDVHTCICKNGEVSKIGRKVDPVTREPEVGNIHIEVPDEAPYRAVRSKVYQVNPGKLSDLSGFVKGVSRNRRT